MINRRGLVIAAVFIVGVLLGVLTSISFIDVDEDKLREATQVRSTQQQGPLRELLLSRLENNEVFAQAAEDIREDQLRNVRIVLGISSMIAIGLALVFSRVEIGSKPPPTGRSVRGQRNQNSTAKHRPQRT